MKKNSRKTIAIAIVLVVAILLSIYAVVKVMQKNQKLPTEEVSQIANEENEKMMADASIERKELTGEEKKKKMEDLSASWDPNIVETQTVNLYSEAELEVNDGEQVQVPIPIPKGYVLSGLEDEKTVGSGVVIYEGDEEVTTSNKDDAQKKRNQWVWVPVYDPSDMYGVDSNGKMWGKLYNFSDTERTADNWSEDNDKIKIKSTTGSREPDLVSYDKDDYLSRYLSETDKEQLSKELKNTFEKTIESIEKYGGFYIGRYETGGLDGTAKVVKGDTNISNQTWYTMYEKCKTLKGENRNVETSMIWGCEWDRTLQWLVDTENKTYAQVGKDSTEWGNYYNKQLTYVDENGVQQTKNKSRSVRIPSGSSEIAKANNIYDMAGNVWDWTLEACSANYRRYRGGNYYGNGYSYPAGYRDYDYPYNSDVYYGCRAALYVEL